MCNYLHGILWLFTSVNSASVQYLQCCFESVLAGFSYFQPKVTINFLLQSQINLISCSIRHDTDMFEQKFKPFSSSCMSFCHTWVQFIILLISFEVNTTMFSRPLFSCHFLQCLQTQKPLTIKKIFKWFFSLIPKHGHGQG